MTQSLDDARDRLLSESKRRNEIDKFYRLERDNNSQVQSRINAARAELAAVRQKFTEADEQNANLISEVFTTCSVQAVMGTSCKK